jgi:protein gp37
MGASSIEWTDATWNPTTGCSEVSAGCDHCYAKVLAHGRLSGVYGKVLPVVDTPENRADTFAVRLWPDRLRDPASWQKPRMVFVNSMSDLFHWDVPEEYVRRIFEAMLQVDRHTYQVLTKRPARMRRFVERNADLFPGGMVPAHVWMGTSVENQYAVHRVRQLRGVPAAIRFLSCEPLLGPLDLLADFFRPLSLSETPAAALNDGCTDGVAPRGEIHWVIGGGESGIGARPMRADWARSLRDQCAAAGVPFFFKQWGEWASFLACDSVHWLEDCALPVDGSLGSVVAGCDGDLRRRVAAAYAADGDILVRIGKRAAGRLLDGVEHNEFPVSRTLAMDV